MVFRYTLPNILHYKNHALQLNLAYLKISILFYRF
uniref:Uncharacterized protein n=1 Tax=Podoviridae sp. ctZkC8 TaxID=2825259 RepID=A0A8S5UC78_9CAUD|nr:MAG TPA: hypothetical protein [Podoviridae sp. ctZkC8]